MVMLSEIKNILDDKLTAQSDKVTCLHDFFVVKIRRHKPDKAQASAALTSTSDMSWPICINGCHRNPLFHNAQSQNSTLFHSKTAAPLIPTFSLKGKYKIIRIAVDYNASNTALV